MSSRHIHRIQKQHLGEGPQKGDSLATFPRLSLPNAGSASEDTGRSRQSPGQMSPHGSTQPLPRCGATDVPPAPTFSTINVQTAPCLTVRLCLQSPHNGPSSLLRTGHQGGSSCPDELFEEAVLLKDKTRGVGKLLPTIISFNLILPVT